MLEKTEEFDLNAYFAFLNFFEMGGGQLDIRSFRYINPKVRRVLEVVSDRCLADFPNHEYHGPDGTVIRLENWQERKRAMMEAEDGILRMPRYRFRLTAMSKPWERATYIQSRADAIEIALKGYHREEDFTINGADLDVARAVIHLRGVLAEFLARTGLDRYAENE